jgi:hypothetical protein
LNNLAARRYPEITDTLHKLVSTNLSSGLSRRMASFLCKILAIQVGGKGASGHRHRPHLFDRSTGGGTPSSTIRRWIALIGSTGTTIVTVSLFHHTPAPEDFAQKKPDNAVDGVV